MSKWKTIESAPKDGTTILVCGGTYDTNDCHYGPLVATDSYVAYWYRDHWRGEDRPQHDVWLVHEPTHWMPKPAPYSKEG